MDRITPIDGYDDVIYGSSNPAFPAGTPVFAYDSNGWVFDTFDLSAYSGASIKIRFHFGSDGSVTEYGWYIDDVSITTQFAGTPEFSTTGAVSVAANTTTNLVFSPPWNAVSGTYKIQVTTHLVGDQKASNDQFSKMVTITDFILDLNSFPMTTAQDPSHEMCGPACAQMTLNYMWWNSSNFTQPPLKFDDQQWLYTTGHVNNTDPTLPYLDTQGLWNLVQYRKPMPYTTYGYNFMKSSNIDQSTMLGQICTWINYTIGTYGGYKPGHPLNVPALVPAYGDYSNWMAVCGIHTDKPAFSLPANLTIYGFWVNDPLPTGIGANSYKTTAEWITTYYKVMQTNDAYNGKYVALCEPPETRQETRVNIPLNKPQFNPEQKQLLQLTQNHDAQITKEIQDQTTQWVIQAAVDGVTEQLIPYDAEFAAVFTRTTPGTPLYVQNLNGEDYYAVPFNIKTPLLKAVGRVLPTTKIPKTTIVILINATDGSFKEVS